MSLVLYSQYNVGRLPTQRKMVIMAAKVKRSHEENVATSEEIAEGERIMEVPLDEIAARNNWNTRKSLDTNLGSFKEFKQNIAQSGQDTPVIARPMAKRGKMHLDLVCGFRRYEAIRQIAKESGNKNPTIKVVVRTLTESEARRLNMRENTARENFTTADLTFGVKQLKTEEPVITSGGIAAILGISQAYASDLLNFTKISPEILEMWRDSKVPFVDEKGVEGVVPHTATHQQMSKLLEAKDGALLSPEAQLELYKSFPKEAKDKARGPDSWKASINAAARTQGEAFGRLVKLGALSPLPGDFWEKYLGLLITIPERAGRAKKSDGTETKGEVTAEIRAEFYNTARAAYQTALVTDFTWPPVKPPVLTKEEKAAAKAAAKAHADAAEEVADSEVN